MAAGKGSSKLLAFELLEKGDELHILCNCEGLDQLIDFLTKLRNAKALPDHIHLMTPSWSGCELTENPYTSDGKLLNMVTIRLLPDDFCRV